MVFSKEVIFTFVALLLITLSCQKANKAELNGTIDYIGSSELYIEKKPIHYKYADKIQYDINPDNRGKFNISIPADSQEVVFFTIDDQKYPLVVKPNHKLSITISRQDFPDSIGINGYEETWNSDYVRYVSEENRIQQKIDEEIDAFRDGKPNEVIDLYKLRYKLAKRHLAETPLDIYYYKNIGEYLVKELENIEIRRSQEDLNPQAQREKILQEAKNLNFFSLKSLQSQRAGIRDFTNAFANSFGLEDSLEKKYEQELLEYDVKRLGYGIMDSARVSVLSYIDDREALAYAKMHLIAERIGEMSPETAEPSYKAFLKEFNDYPRYTRFLKDFYDRVERVSPGNPAIPFTLQNQYGEKVRMEEFSGKYVLLDFWASWCIPCLEEFPDMRMLYNKYNREQFEIVAISIGEDSLAWRESLNKFKNPWPQLYAGNSFQQETFSAYQGGGIPFYILVDPEGNIERYNDIRPSFNLDQVLDSLIIN